MSVQVKICGLKSAEMVDAAVKAGTDFVGFVDYPSSPRHISLEKISTLLPLLPAHVQPVLVTVNPSDDWLKSVNTKHPACHIQLHGKETPERVREIKMLCKHARIIKALPIRPAEDVAMAKAYADCADMLLFDSSSGGSGKIFDWNILKDFFSPLPWFLSGGLSPENVVHAMKQTGAHYVDVSSGVESSPGVKDTALITQFIQAAKHP